MPGRVCAGARTETRSVIYPNERLSCRARAWPVPKWSHRGASARTRTRPRPSPERTRGFDGIYLLDTDAALSPVRPTERAARTGPSCVIADSLAFANLLGTPLPAASPIIIKMPTRELEQQVVWPECSAARWTPLNASVEGGEINSYMAITTISRSRSRSGSSGSSGSGSNNNINSNNGAIETKRERDSHLPAGGRLVGKFLADEPRASQLQLEWQAARLICSPLSSAGRSSRRPLDHYGGPAIAAPDAN